MARSRGVTGEESLDGFKTSEVSLPRGGRGTRSTPVGPCDSCGPYRPLKSFFSPAPGHPSSPLGEHSPETSGRGTVPSRRELCRKEKE